MTMKVHPALSMLLLTAALLQPRPALGAQPATRRLTILHTNDLHGHILPFAYAEKGRGGVERDSVGGAARRATLIRQIRRTLDHPSILVDAGDIFTRGPLTNAYEGLADVAAMNAVGYEVAAVGNNEFKAKDAIDADDATGSQAALLKVVRQSRFPWLCANLSDAEGKSVPGVRPYWVRRLRGLRLGIVGVTAPRSANYPQTRGWRITDPIAALRTWVPKVRRECDLVVALTHIGYPLDLLAAAGVEGIDVIVGGDSHTFLYEPTWVNGPGGRRVPIVQAGEFGANLGRLDLELARQGDRWRVQTATGRLLLVDDTLVPARDVEMAIARYVRPFREVVGKLDRPGETPDERARVTTSVIVEAARRAMGADLAINPLGDGLFDRFRRSTLTLYDVYAAMPFRNRVVTAVLSGSEIEKIIAAHPTTVVAGLSRPYASGRVYRVAMVDYIAESTYAVPALRIVQRGCDVREAVVSYLRARSPATSAGPAHAEPSLLRSNPYALAGKHVRGPTVLAR